MNAGSYDSDSPGRSGTTTPRSSISEAKGSSLTDYASPLKFFQKPIVRQYFHKGLLWRASDQEEVQSFELFVDLLYVGIIAINGDFASEHPTGLSLLRFVITFTLSYKIWNDMTMLISWFETNDIYQRISVLFLLACLFGYTTNITEAFDTTYSQMIAFYLTARLYMATYLIIVAFLIPMIRYVMITLVVTHLIGAALWIGSIYVAYPQQLALIWLAIFVDACAATAHLVPKLASCLGPKMKERVESAFEFYPGKYTPGVRQNLHDIRSAPAFSTVTPTD